MAQTFADRLLQWFDQHGRHDLPWQKNRTLYRVWVSEIMLQQTQVQTVIPYFHAFMKQFPSLKRLASARQDEVLKLWVGLGYYSRARNLLKAAQQVQSDHGGRMPRELDELVALPGIGRSTAAAILSQALDERHAILDGNVKRVLSRFHAVEGWPGAKPVEQTLWQHAEQHTPASRNADFTQAIMDLGATLCTRSRPTCDACPVAVDCCARALGSVSAFPSRKPRREMPVKATRLLILVDSEGAIMLEKRPPAGIWGGLWSLPEAEPEQDVPALCKQRWGLSVKSHADDPVMRHTFSHYHLDIHPSACQIVAKVEGVHESTEVMWLQPDAELPAVAAPVSRLIAQYAIND